MNMNKKCRFILITVFCVLGLSILMKTTTSLAASSTDWKNGTSAIKSGTVYNYDLDCDGKTEKILFKYEADDATFTTSCKIYVNDKLCFTKTQEDSFCFNLTICDLDTTDSYLDFYLDAKTSSDGITYSAFARYNGKKIVVTNQFNPDIASKYFSIFRYSLDKVRGNGTFRVVADTPIFSETTGCYYCYLEFKLEDNKITPVATNFYNLSSYSKAYKYKAAKSFSPYKKVGSKSTAFTVKKGDTLTFDKLYITKTGKVYMRILNSTGTKGWINGGFDDLFEERPFWG